MPREKQKSPKARTARRGDPPPSNFERGAADADIEITRNLPAEEDREEVEQRRATPERKTNER